MENETNSGLIPNDPITADLQQIGVAAFRDADKAEGLKRSCRTSLVYLLIHAAAAQVEAVVKNQKGETEFAHAFTIAEFCDADHVKAAIGDNNRHKGAMVKAVIERLAGIADPTGAQKQALSQAAPVAFHLAEKLGGWEEAVKVVTLSKRGRMQVPGVIMLKEPGENAAESEVERYEREKAVPFTLDGAKGHSFNELSARVRPKQEREGSSGQGADSGKAMSRLDAAKVLLRGAVGADDWAVYMADLSSAELLAIIAAAGEADRDNG
jgi:hypothetical protein